MKTYTIYTKHFDDEPKKPIATITGEKARAIVDMLFDYMEFSNYGISYDTIWYYPEEDDNE